METNNDLLAFADFAKDNDHIGMIKINDQKLSAREFEIFKAGARHGRAMMSPTNNHAGIANGVAELIVAADIFCQLVESGKVRSVNNYNRFKTALGKIK